MKAISIVLFAGTVALACGYTSTRSNAVNADQDFLRRQSAILEVLQHTHQNDVQPQLHEIANKYVIEQNYQHYTNVEAIQQFVAQWKQGLLPLNEIFTIYNPQHREQTVGLFHLFYYAKDWDTLYKSIVWARFNVNEGQFVYALTVAVIHRTDLQGLELPAIYEIYPQYFFSSEVIQRAQSYKQQGFRGLKKVEGVYTVTIPANYTGDDVHINEEQRVSYFTEDIGLNAYYYYFHADYPFWLGGQEVTLNKDRRGEFWLYNHQQLLARYYLERLSNNLGSIPELTWWTPIKTGYYPNLRHYTGIPFISRDNEHTVYRENTYYDVDVLAQYEARIINAIDAGFILLQDGTKVNITSPEGIDQLGNLIQGNPDSVNTRYYRYLRNVLSVLNRSFGQGNVHQHITVPSVLEHPETQLRDPLFWQLLKRIVKYYWIFKNNLPPYTRQEIDFEDVKIESTEVDKLVTYFDKFDADITNAVDIEVPTTDNVSELRQFGRISHHNGEDIVIKARQWRLNYVPFKYVIHATSAKAQPSVVRVYLGPKQDENGHTLTINQNRQNFVLLDVFKQDLVAGKNVITRESRDFAFTVQDRTTYFELYKWVWSATKGDNQFPLENTEAHSGFPNRLVLPKGKRGGQTFTLFFHISPYHAPATEQYTGYNHYISTGVGSGARWVDSLAFGYPLDRLINERVWNTPNMYYQDVNIFHKKETEVN